VRTADLIGQLGDPNRLQKCPALFYEFEKKSLNKKIGYKTLRRSWDRGKARQRVEARSLLCYWATTELGISQTQLAQRLPLKQPAVSNAARTGACLVRQRQYTIEPDK
jgi:hypothetical protein